MVRAKIYAYDHVLQFIQNFTNSFFSDIDEGILCRIFTLTLTGQAKDWCLLLLVASVDSWDQFTIMFLHAFQDYDYDKVCDQLETLHRFEGESFNDFLFRFKLICLQFKSKDLPPQIELVGWFKHLVSLPGISNNCDESKNVTFLSLFTAIEESTTNKFENQQANQQSTMQIENSNNVQSEVKISEFSHSEIDDQSQSMDIQIHNEESEICIDEDEQESSGREFSGTYHQIVHFSLYPDLFNESNSISKQSTIPLYINTILENKGVSIHPTDNELPIIDQEKEFLNNYIFNKPENGYAFEFDQSSGSSVSYDKEENANEKCEVIYNDDLRIENVETLHPSVMVMSGPHILNSPSQSIFEDEKTLFQ
jgi:hypothetical protein